MYDVQFPLAWKWSITSFHWCRKESIQLNKLSPFVSCQEGQGSFPYCDSNHRAPATSAVCVGKMCSCEMSQLDWNKSWTVWVWGGWWGSTVSSALGFCSQFIVGVLANHSKMKFRHNKYMVGEVLNAELRNYCNEQLCATTPKSLQDQYRY